jgi:nitrogen fixation protein FixH
LVVLKWRFFAILGFLLALSACGGGGTQPGYIRQQQTVDGLSITLERPQQAEILKDYELFVTLNDASGKPVDGAAVFLDMAMPAMSMGANQPIADGLGDGRYRIKGAFSMEGDWRVIAHATVAGKEYTATFDQPVTLQK